MGIRIAVTDLKPGMYVVDLEKKNGVDASVFSIEGFILSEREIPQLRKQGFETAFVDPARSQLPCSKPEPGQALNEEF